MCSPQTHRVSYGPTYIQTSTQRTQPIDKHVGTAWRLAALYHTRLFLCFDTIYTAVYAIHALQYTIVCDKSLCANALKYANASGQNYEIQPISQAFWRPRQNMQQLTVTWVTVGWLWRSPDQSLNRTVCAKISQTHLIQKSLKYK